MFLIWLWRAKKDTGESMASLLFAHRRTTYWKKSEIRCNREYKIKDNKLLNLEQTCNIKKKYTFSPVLWIFSVSWSTAMLEGAQTNTCPLFCLTKWYTMVADVTVLPVPGGPLKSKIILLRSTVQLDTSYRDTVNCWQCDSGTWMRLSGRWRTVLTAYTWEWFSSGRLGTLNLLGSWHLMTTSSTSCPRSLW